MLPCSPSWPQSKMSVGGLPKRTIKRETFAHPQSGVDGYGRVLFLPGNGMHMTTSSGGASIKVTCDGGTETVASSSCGCWDAQGLAAGNKLSRLGVFSLNPPLAKPFAQRSISLCRDSGVLATAGRESIGYDPVRRCWSSITTPTSSPSLSCRKVRTMPLRRPLLANA
ncbi:hypothetical protein BDU57DRAFT_81873 [Ampelomyces quisqualis]|uniref:Uncharacterized protein n=1 Tax=Ampelomyces quisqualis TaxID=50730 RepID=A0A6A5Q950_AMPQU|nr:hypothetical protein BDU57DRAFT_81873 [Ampelomyces quisqualis]